MLLISVIIGVLIEALFPLEPVDDEFREESGSDEELNAIITELYRPLVQAMVIVTQHENSDEVRGRFFSVILALLDKMSAAMFSASVDEKRTELDRRDFLAEMLQMCRQMLARPPFSSTWRQMIITQNKTIHKALRFVMSAIQNYFSKENFSPDIWKEFMQTCITFVEQLRDVDEFMATDTERKLIKAATHDFRSMWFRLSPIEKLNYIPELVGPFLKVALLEDNESQLATIPVFFDMLQTEVSSNSERTFDQFATELITKLDLYIEQGQGTPTFQANFVKVFKSLCLPAKELWEEGGEELIDRVDRLLSHLFEYRQIREQNDSIENVMSRTIQLLRYYEEFGHHELYVSYVYKLYDLHILHSNELEAAKTLLRHTTMLTWSDDKLPDYLIRRGLNRHCATERQLKENLLLEAANLFDKGDLWEDAIRILKQLSVVYEEIIIDYVKLSNLTERISSLYRKIDKEERAHYYYYFVAFYGKGFPSYLDGHRFVFRSNRLERHVDFVQRIGEIFNLDPMGEPCPFEDSYDANPAIKGYYRHYNIRHFEYSRIEERRDTKWTRIDESNEVLRMWIVRRKLNTFESLPCELRCSEISNISEPILISPLQHSVEQMQRKNKELREMGKSIEHNTSISLKKLSGAIMGVVRAAVMGGIKNYEVYFTDECANICEAHEKALVMELSALIVEQVEILEYCIYIHSKHCVDESDKLIHGSLVDAYEEHKRYIEEGYGKTTSILPPGTSIRLSVHSNEDKERRHTEGESATGSSSTLKARAFNAMQMLTAPSSKRGSTTPLTVEKIPSVSRLSTDHNLSVPPISPSASLGRDSAISLSSIAMKIRKQANSSLDGIRIRKPSTSSLSSYVPPPLPPRPPTDV
ncbi:hypothetical protein WR25_15471 [Diploscapter pachys]|uniref:DOCKER domain-containing protein n=1 Tax=Diploscapter pachys TaxID=2018661 RepID=A0A2A2L472_9BILA|nr:hypothetical protein WR25_15471 [Diploscapter pachys]